MDIFTLQQVMRYKQDPSKKGFNNGTQFYGKHTAVLLSFARGESNNISTHFNSTFTTTSDLQGMLGNMLGAYVPSSGVANARNEATAVCGYRHQIPPRLLQFNFNNNQKRYQVGIHDYMGAHSGTTDYTPYLGLFCAIRNNTQSDITVSLGFHGAGYTTNTHYAFGYLTPDNADNDLVTTCTMTKLAAGTGNGNSLLNIPFAAGKTTILFNLFPYVYAYGQNINGYYASGSFYNFHTLETYPQLEIDREVTNAIYNKIGARSLDGTDMAAFAPLWNKASQHERIVGMY